MASLSVRNSFEMIQDGLLEEHAIELVEKNPEEFKRRFGDGFV